MTDQDKGSAFHYCGCPQHLRDRGTAAARGVAQCTAHSRYDCPLVAASRGHLDKCSISPFFPASQWCRWLHAPAALNKHYYPAVHAEQNNWSSPGAKTPAQEHNDSSRHNLGRGLLKPARLVQLYCKHPAACDQVAACSVGCTIDSCYEDMFWSSISWNIIGKYGRMRLREQGVLE